jgi:hypothetical protein
MIWPTRSNSFIWNKDVWTLKDDEPMIDINLSKIILIEMDLKATTHTKWTYKYCIDSV